MVRIWRTYVVRGGTRVSEETPFLRFCAVHFSRLNLVRRRVELYDSTVKRCVTEVEDFGVVINYILMYIVGPNPERLLYV